MDLMRVCVGTLLAAAVVWGQGSGARKLEFEVASVKPMEQSADPRVRVGVQIDGSQVHLNQTSLKDAVRYAYGVKFYQVVGPDWMPGERFNISAKLPDRAKREDIPEMMKTLLEQRFQMKVHREQREMPVY